MNAVVFPGVELDNPTRHLSRGARLVPVYN
jgi:hypothetical protein